MRSLRMITPQIDTLHSGDVVVVRLASGPVELPVLSIQTGFGDPISVLDLEIPDNLGELSIPLATLCQTKFFSWTTDQAYHVAEESMSTKFARPGAFVADLPAPSTLDIDWTGLKAKIDKAIESLKNPDQDRDPVMVYIGDQILSDVLRPTVAQFVGRKTDPQLLPQMKAMWQQAMKLMEQGELVPPVIWGEVREKLQAVAEHIMRRTIENMPVVQLPPEKKRVERPNAPWDLSD